MDNDSKLMVQAMSLLVRMHHYVDDGLGNQAGKEAAK
jgi:hypothetical protein